MLRRFYIFLWVVYSLLTGCQSATDVFITAGFDYFPLETGRYVIYDVEENQYSLNTTPFQRMYQRKEVIGASYTDVTEQTAYQLMRYRRATESQLWQADSVWSERLLTNEAIRTENGQNFVKLVFTIRDKLT